MSEAIDPRVAAKEAAGRHAARYVVDGMRVGLGTGSTVHWTIVELGERVARGALSITCTSTSTRTHELATSFGITVVSPDDLGVLDVAIDGADEVDLAFNLTKGGGGAHTREKLVAEMSPRFIVVVDESKLVPALGPFGTPLEVLDFAPAVVAARIRALGATDVTIRPERSDNGNLLGDAHFGTIDDPVALATALERIPGLVEHGIFRHDLVERVVIAGDDGSVRELVNDPSSRT
jgi:ribose 5-phosphate isomerase A